MDLTPDLAPFPSSSGTELDAFTGSGALSGSWTTISGTPQRISDQFGGASAGAGTPSTALWNAADFGPYLEAWVTVPTIPSVDNDEVAIFYNISAGFNGYYLRYVRSGGAMFLQVIRLDAASGTPFASSGIVTAAGASFGVRCNAAGQHTIFHKLSGGSWERVFSGDDGRYLIADQVGLRVTNTIARLDGFFLGLPPTGASDLAGRRAIKPYAFAPGRGR